MWRLLAGLSVFLFAACAQEPRVESEDAQSGARIVRTIDLPLGPMVQAAPTEAPSRSFQGRGMEGRLTQTGEWTIKGTVQHTRLRCGTYELGLQVGRGSTACTNVEWTTDVQYGTRHTHCNSAARVHTGGGEFPQLAGVLQQSSCARVVIRCQGTC